jgi:hypothetical protein
MDETRQHNHAACADDKWLGPDALDDLLEVADVSGSDPQQRVRLPRHRAGIDNLGMLGHGGGDVAR